MFVFALQDLGDRSPEASGRFLSARQGAESGRLPGFGSLFVFALQDLGDRVAAGGPTAPASPT